MRQARSEAGFTLIELVIVVGIIGMLAAIAIPSFMRYQARARRGEAYSNITALVRAEKSYQAVKDEYWEVELSQPDPTLYGGLGVAKMPWDAAASTAFDEVGWNPEGDVYYTYEINTPAGVAHPCTCSGLCFTATATGNADGDGVTGVVIYSEPQRDANGAVIGVCPSATVGHLPPIDPDTLSPVYNEVAALNPSEF